MIGSAATLSLFSIGQINLTSDGCELYLQKTRLGWGIAGGTTFPNTASATCHLSNLEANVAKFWEIEEIVSNRPFSKEERECEVHFRETTTRATNGRYTVRFDSADLANN